MPGRQEFDAELATFGANTGDIPAPVVRWAT
jgi:hypothetical protein